MNGKTKHITTRKAILVMALLFCTKIFCQNNQLGSWDIIALNITLKNNWGLYGETQTRSQRLTTDFHYHEFKGGIQYSFPKKATLFMGLGNFTTYNFPGNFKSPAIAKEFRLWQQFVLTNNINRVKLQHRYRLEQRWINGNYFNRFRYRINPVIPINHNAVVPKTFFASAFTELFFTNEAPYFLRNRFFIGCGYEFSDPFTLQFGFLRQYDYRKSDDGSGKNYLQLSLLFTLDKSTSKKETHPNTMD